MNGFLKLISVAAVVVLCASVASATIIVQNQWNLGENDGAGAIVGGTSVNPTVDIGPGNATNGGPMNLTLTSTGSPTYVAGAYAGSPLAVNFANPPANGDTPTNYYSKVGTGYLFPSANNNSYGVDFWFELNSIPSSGEHELVQFGGGSSVAQGLDFEIYNANTGGGAHLILSDWGGRSFTADYALTTGTWTHVVWANTAGTGHFYINGTEYNDSFGHYTGIGAINGSNGGTDIANNNYTYIANTVFIGTRKYSTGNPNAPLDGAIDAVRTFTFAAGQFNINDTNPTPEPGTLALLATGLAALLAYAWRKRK